MILDYLIILSTTEVSGIEEDLSEDPTTNILKLGLLYICYGMVCGVALSKNSWF